MEVIYTKKTTLVDRTVKVTTSEMINQYGSEFQRLEMDDQFKAMWQEAKRRVELCPEPRAHEDLKEQITTLLSDLAARPRQ